MIPPKKNRSIQCRITHELAIFGSVKAPVEQSPHKGFPPMSLSHIWLRYNTSVPGDNKYCGLDFRFYAFLPLLTVCVNVVPFRQNSSILYKKFLLVASHLFPAPNGIYAFWIHLP